METFGQDLRQSLYRGRDPARAVDIRDLRHGAASTAGSGL